MRGQPQLLGHAAFAPLLQCYSVSASYYGRCLDCTDAYEAQLTYPTMASVLIPIAPRSTWTSQSALRSAPSASHALIASGV